MPLDPVEMGPYVPNMRTMALGSAIVRLDLPDLCANDQFALQIHADMEVHVLAAIQVLDFCAFVLSGAEGHFVKKVRLFFDCNFPYLLFFMSFVYLVWSEDTKSK